MIYTSYFGNLKRLPPDIVPIAISGNVPDGLHILRYKKLAPKYAFFVEWLKNQDNEYYKKCYQEQVLDKLDPETVIKELTELAGGKQFALICYEAPLKFCHRHLVADWLTAHGYDAKELMIIYEA